VSAFVIAPIPAAETRALRRSVLRPHQTLEQLAADEPADPFAVGAFRGGQLAAVGMISPGDDPGVWRVRGMATEPQYRGRGAGSAVLDALLQHAVARGATRVWCNARTPALGLYERAGFRPTSDEFELAGIGPHFRMELINGAGSAHPAGAEEAAISVRRRNPGRG
jgi:ribosomal protein S18 acetylase RimI-like enzyme